MSRETPIPVSVFVLTKNEEANLPTCLGALGEFDEVFVVDSESTDATRQIAIDYGVTVIPFEWDGKYPKKKQWALDNVPASHDWVLFVDADEEMTASATNEMRSLLRAPDRDAYFIDYDFFFAGQPLRYGHRTKKLALSRRSATVYPAYPDLGVAEMWEVEGHYQPEIAGTVGNLRNRVVHHDQHLLYDYFARHNRYSDWEAALRSRKVLLSQPESQQPLRRLMKRAFDAVPGRGLVAFIHCFVLKRGFLDGRAGLHYALARGFYYWQISAKIDEQRRLHSQGNESRPSATP